MSSRFVVYARRARAQARETGRWGLLKADQGRGGYAPGRQAGSLELCFISRSRPRRRSRRRRYCHFHRSRRLLTLSICRRALTGVQPPEGR